MRKNHSIDKGLLVGCGVSLIPIILWLLFIIGEIMCFVKFVKSDFEPSYRRECIYGISFFTGFGCITGWMDFPDTKPKTK